MTSEKGDSITTRIKWIGIFGAGGCTYLYLENRGKPKSSSGKIFISVCAAATVGLTLGAVGM